MGVVNTKSTIITNADATPPAMTNNNISGGVLRVAKGTVAVAAADDNDSTFRICRIPAHCVVDSVWVASDALSTGASYAFGVYNVPGTGSAAGSAVDADVWADAVDLSAAVAKTEITREKTATDLSKIEQPIWQLAGVSASPTPGTMYDVVATATAAGTAAGDISVWVYYTDGT